jgi:hypothetical protein
MLLEPDSLSLPAGKVPTAGAVTLSQEFLLVTVWDVKKMKGQIAVIANKGALVTSNNEQFMWGLPSWPVVKQMKILGYINLPIKAPSAIAVSNDEENGSGRGNGDNRGLDLNLQSERDTWYNWSGAGLSVHQKRVCCRSFQSREQGCIHRPEASVAILPEYVFYFSS